jgi:hypothetical protein
LSNKSKIRSKMANQNQILKQYLRVFKTKFNLLCNYLLLVRRKFCGNKFFKKSKMAAGIKINLSRHLGYFKNFYPQIFRLINNINLMQKKKIENMLQDFRVMLKNQILIHHFRSFLHLTTLTKYALA